MYLFFLLFVFLMLLNSLTSNIVIWWRVFVLMTLTFIFLQKGQGSFDCSLRYFLLQEFLGFLFLIFIFFNLQLIVLLIKVGASPFHFWIFGVFSGVDNFLLMWFLTIQKLPFLPVLLILIKLYLSILLLFGILFCYYQLLFVKNYKLILGLSSTESFNWLLMGIFIGSLGFMLFSFYYLFNIVLIINYQSLGVHMNYFLELIVVFLNIPLSFTFFVKIFMLRVSINFRFLFSLLLLFSIVLSSLRFFNWIVYYSVRENKFFRDQLRYYFMVFYFLFFFIYFFRFSKNNYIILIG